MRRGLISWSKAELPTAVLDARVARAQAAMRQAGLDALAVYTTPARAAAVAWLAGFVPYWNQGLLVVPATGRPVLVSALSNRVADWLQRNAHVVSVRNSPKIGADAAAFVAATTPKGRIGVVDIGALPALVVSDLGTGGHAVIDATALFAGLRLRPDPADLALHARAAHIARRALEQPLGDMREANDLIARLEHTARADGAEEVYPAIAADLGQDRRLARIEGGKRLGDRFAVRLSVAYKGAWVRVTRTVDRDDGSTERVRRAAEQFAAAVASLPATDGLSGLPNWLVEATTTTMPLEPVAGALLDQAEPVAPGRLVNVQATVMIDEAPVLIGGPVLVGLDGAPSSLLAVPA